MLDLIQTTPGSEAEVAVWSASALKPATGGASNWGSEAVSGRALRTATGGASSWEMVSQTRLMDINGHLTDMMQAREASRSRSRSPRVGREMSGLKRSHGCPCLNEIAESVRLEMESLKEHPRIMIEHFFPHVIDFGIENNYEILRDHARKKVHHLVEEEEPKPFYIGICCSALRRWVGYRGLDMGYRGHRTK